MASTHETVAVALQTVLQGIVQGVNGAVYTPSLVKRVPVFPDDINPDVSLTTVYLLRPGEEPRKITVQGCYVEGELEMFAFLATVSNTQPDDAARWQAAADMVADVLGAINADTTLGGAAVDVYGTIADFERWAPTWAVVELRMIIRYRYNRTLSGR